MAKAKNSTMEELHEVLAKSLLDRVKSGEATAADLSVARQFLKDNGIEATSPHSDRTLTSLSEVVPFATEETG